MLGVLGRCKWLGQLFTIRIAKRFLYIVFLSQLAIFADAPPMVKEKRIAVVIPSYNNQEWYKKNLDSVFSQNYSNYTIIYVDDNSPDGTGDMVKEYVDQRGMADRCLIIKNEVRYGPLFNRYKAIHSCNDDTIIVLLDGDDWLKHSDVLSYINHLYCTEGILLSVGNACRSTTGQKIGYRDYTEKELNEFGFRQLGFRGVHPRTFYAGLFKKIKAQDLMHGGKFLAVATDVAFMLPMFEMARNRYKYVHDILCVYNDENPLNLYKSKFERQVYFDLITRNREFYEQLSDGYHFLSSTQDKKYVISHLLFMEEETETADFFYNREAEAIKFHSIVKVGNGDPYRTVKTRRFCVNLHTLDIGYSLDQIYKFRFNFKDCLLKTLADCKGHYILVSTEKIVESDSINFYESLKKLEETGAMGIMFGKSDGNFLKENSYDVAPWNASYNLYLFNKWMHHTIFKEISDCVGILLRREDFIGLINRLEIFHPNFYTLLSACNSVLREDVLFLAAHITNQKGVVN